MLPSETKMAYKIEVIESLVNEKLPGKIVASSRISNKMVYYTSLSTGEVVFYEVTHPQSSNSNNDSTYCSIHFIVPKHQVDELERKSAISTVCKNINAFTAPVRQFLLANKIAFFVVGAVTALIEYLF
jgi:hypothetical protein